MFAVLLSDWFFQILTVERTLTPQFTEVCVLNGKKYNWCLLFILLGLYNVVMVVIKTTIKTTITIMMINRPNYVFDNDNENITQSTNILHWLIIGQLELHNNNSSLPLQVKTQYLHFRFHANWFLLPWKISEKISRRSMLFNN